MEHISFDIHKNQSQICIVTPRGEEMAPLVRALTELHAEIQKADEALRRHVPQNPTAGRRRVQEKIGSARSLLGTTFRTRSKARSSSDGPFRTMESSKTRQTVEDESEWLTRSKFS